MSEKLHLKPFRGFYYVLMRQVVLIPERKEYWVWVWYDNEDITVAHYSCAYPAEGVGSIRLDECYEHFKKYVEEFKAATAYNDRILQAPLKPQPSKILKDPRKKDGYGKR